MTKRAAAPTVYAPGAAETVTLLLRYRGISPEQASREAAMLIGKAAIAGSWFHIVEPLVELRRIMRSAAAGVR